MKVKATEKSPYGNLSLYPVSKTGENKEIHPSSVKTETGKDMRVAATRKDSK